MMKYKKTRIYFLFLILNSFILFFSGLFIEEIYKLQFSNSEYFRNQALSYREKTEVIEARRGSILDRNYNEVANTVNAFNIGIYPSKIMFKTRPVQPNFVATCKEHDYLELSLWHDQAFSWSKHLL